MMKRPTRYLRWPRLRPGLIGLAVLVMVLAVFAPVSYRALASVTLAGSVTTAA